MPDNGEVKTLYSDEEKTNAIYPRTVISAVTGVTEALNEKMPKDISTLTEKTTLTNNDLFVVDDGVETQKIKASNMLSGIEEQLETKLSTSGANRTLDLSGLAINGVFPIASIPFTKQAQYSDLDNIGETGLYALQTTPALLIHLRWDNNYMVQIIQVFSETSSIKWRRKDGGTWGAWKTM